MNRTRIEYLHYTWNPVVGCSGVGCAVRDVCWARAFARRQKNRCELCYRFVPHVHFERFDEPLKCRKPSRIGVCFSGEFYDREVSENVRASLYIRMDRARWHRFLILTKQPQNVKDTPPSNVWVGVSVNVKADLWRLYSLTQTRVNSFVSFEPLLEDMGDITEWLEGVKWVIIGAQTHPTVQPDAAWVDSIVKQAERLGIPVFMKNNLLYHPLQSYPEELKL